MSDDYTADSIIVLTGREAVRKRPGMYAGDPDDGRGALNLLLEALADAIDAVLLGRCTRIDVRIEADDSVTITDDGPGIPPDILVDMLERRSWRPTVDGHRPHVHLGFGLGLMVTNALCDPFEVDTVHNGEQATIRYASGLCSAPLARAPTARPSGTRIRFRPDPQLFRGTRVPRVDLTRHLEDLASLLPALTLSWTFAGDAAAGLVGRVRNEVADPLGGIAHHRGDYTTTDGPISVEVALAWHTDARARPPQIHSFANFKRTDAGQHVSGLLDGVRAFVPRRARARVLDGLVAIVTVILADVFYGSPTRSSLQNPTARPTVKQATLTALHTWAEHHPEAALALRTNRPGPPPK